MTLPGQPIPFPISVEPAQILHDPDYRGVVARPERAIIMADFVQRGQTYEAIGHIDTDTCATELVKVEDAPRSR